MAGESAPDLKVDLTDLYLSAPVYARAGGTIGNAVTQAASQLEALGEFWGNDQAGQAFGGKYVPDQGKILQVLGIVAGQVQGISDGITRMADNYDIAEQANIRKANALNQEMQ